MDVYSRLVDLYNRFLNLFPASIQWLITLAILIALIVAFVNLISANPLFVILLIILLPLIAPIFQNFIAGIYHFFLYLIHSLSAKAPAS
jgi:hypothetical protein